jgi:perosamine synthetase
LIIKASKSNKFIPVNEPDLNGNEKKYLQECIDTGWISSEGPYVEKFEIGMAKLTNRKHAISVCNGTAALELAVQAIGINPGDEVIIPSFTIISCGLAVIRAGAVPVYVDADPKTWNMSVEQIEDLVTEKTKAIMAVHIYGITVDMDRLIEIAKKYKLSVIEDAAEVIGQTYKGKPCGSFGDVSTFSFYPNKHITTGEGGMVLVNDEEIAEKCKSLRNLCFGKSDRFVHENLGWNFRMSNLQAAVGVAQLENLALTLTKKRKVGILYQEAFRECSKFVFPIDKTDYCENIYWVFGLVSSNPKRDAKWWMQRLRNSGIGSRPFFYPMHKQPCLQQFHRRTCSLKNCEWLAKFGFYLPSSPLMLPENIEMIAEKTIKFSNQ